MTEDNRKSLLNYKQVKLAMTWCTHEAGSRRIDIAYI